MSYAVNAHATRLAIAGEADDALVVCDGVVCEVPTAAIAWVKDGVVFSPDPATQPILDSVTRRILGDLTTVTLGTYPLSDVLAADEVFLLSATRPVLPVHAIDEVSYPTDGPIISELRAAFAAHVDNNLDPL